MQVGDIVRRNPNDPHGHHPRIEAHFDMRNPNKEYRIVSFLRDPIDGDMVQIGGIFYADGVTLVTFFADRFELVAWPQQLIHHRRGINAPPFERQPAVGYQIDAAGEPIYIGDKIRSIHFKVEGDQWETLYHVVEYRDGFPCVQWEGRMNVEAGPVVVTIPKTFIVVKEEDVAAKPKAKPVVKKPAKKKKFNVRDAKTQLRKVAKKRTTGVCNYAIIMNRTERFEDIRTNWGDVCHARLNCGPGAISVLDFLDNKAKVSEELRPLWKKYITYILKRSPFRIAYHQKEVKNFIANGCEMDVSQPADVLAGAAIALRMGTEKQHLMLSWKYFVEQGFSEETAWLLSYAFRATPDGKNITGVYPMDGGHQPISGEMNADVLFKFLAVGYPAETLKKKPFSESSGYAVFGGMGHDVYRGRGGAKIDGPSFLEFRDANFKGEKHGTGWNATFVCTNASVNDFAKLVEEKINSFKVKA